MNNNNILYHSGKKFQIAVIIFLNCNEITKIVIFIYTSYFAKNLKYTFLSINKKKSSYYVFLKCLRLGKNS